MLHTWSCSIQTCRHDYVHVNTYMRTCILSSAMLGALWRPELSSDNRLALYPTADCLTLAEAVMHLGQAERGQGRPAASHGSDSSSDPSEEVLDDPTNIALSQRAPAHLQQRGTLPPHGDPLLQAAQAEAADVEEEPLPVRGMPNKQGEWIRKQGMVSTTWHASSRQMLIAVLVLNALCAYTDLYSWIYPGPCSVLCWLSYFAASRHSKLGC